VTLPDDWTMEQKGNLLFLDRPPEVCSVTIDLKQRKFSAGRIGPGPWPSSPWPSISNVTYVGRGWRARLIADAVKWLGAQ